MQQSDHKYSVPPPPPLLSTRPTEISFTTCDVSPNTRPRTPTAEGVAAERLVVAPPTPPTPRPHHKRCRLGSGRKRNAVDVSNYPEFLRASRRRKLPTSLEEKVRQLNALKHSKTTMLASPPVAFSIQPLFQSCWIAETHVKLKAEGASDKDDGVQKEGPESGSRDPNSILPIPFAPFLFGKDGVGPDIPILSSPKAVRQRASLTNKLDDMNLRTQSTTGAKGQAFRTRTGMYARGA